MSERSRLPNFSAYAATQLGKSEPSLFDGLSERAGAEKYDFIKWNLYSEFDDIGDYIWKSPEFIQSQTEIEKQKMKEYFPKGGMSATWRSFFESNKLTNVFPYMIAVGNFFVAMSVFEWYLFMITTELGKDIGKAVASSSERSASVSSRLNYLQTCDVAPKELSAQIRAAVTIRNGLSHAGGMLSWSKRSQRELVRLVKTKEFLSPEGQAGGNKTEEPEYIFVHRHEFGDRLIITNNYSFLLTSYLKRYLFETCELINLRYNNEGGA